MRADPGKAMMPKPFRRRSAYYSQHQAGYTAGDFWSFVKAQDKENTFYLADDFLKNGAHSATVQFGSEHMDHQGQFGLTPDKLVFSRREVEAGGCQGQGNHRVVGTAADPVSSSTVACANAPVTPLQPLGGAQIGKVVSVGGAIRAGIAACRQTGSAANKRQHDA